MKRKKNLVLVSVVLVLALSYFLTPNIISVKNPDELQNENFDLLATSDASNLELLESIFDARNSEYSINGYYPQIYSDSLQATYYALYTLNSIGKLGDIDQQATINYVMSFYNYSSHVFSDENSDRYLASKIPGRYYPLSTLLEVNCYAVLSLKILDDVSAINVNEMLTYIWSCYHPVLYGFIGQPYDSSLEEGFKVPTADNTYYAVTTLDALGVDWNLLSQDRDNIASFVDSLQSTGSSTGFYNDKEGLFDSLMEPEPNQFASYYCLKTLEVFGSSYVSIIDTPTFHQHLTTLYHSLGAYFDASDSVWAANYSNLVATAISLELADLTGFTSFNRSEVVNFLLDNRNYRGGWEASTTIKYHELIDTFQIVRSLSNTGDVSLLSLSDKNEIAAYLGLFFRDVGYSLLSEDYTSINLLYSLISSYQYFGRIGELNIQSIYDSLLGSLLYQGGYYDFFGSTGMDLTRVGFRSKPFDYYTAGHHEFVEDINHISSTEYLFKTLDSLDKIFKLNDFALIYDLSSILQHVIDSQFLDPAYTENFGAFLINKMASSSEWKNTLIYLKYSYYAIELMELIGQYLGLGDVTSQYFIDLGFDLNALGTYIARNVVETGTEIYFDYQYSNSPEIALENLYYAISILTAIDQFDLDTVKVQNFVVNNLNYSNAKSVYFCYKISKLLDLNINFDIGQTHGLVQNAYSDAHNQFYETVEKKELDADIFMWLCEIAKNDDVRLSASYSDIVSLGSNNIFSVELVNLILSDFGQYSTVKIESAQLGTFVLDQLSNYTYQKEVNVSADPANYPIVQGELCAYDGAIKKTSVPFSFTTTFDSEFTNTTVKTESRIEVIINGSHQFASGNKPIFGGSMYADVYRGGIVVDFLDLITLHGVNSSTFTFDYSPTYFGNYSFDFFLNDPYYSNPQYICNQTFEYRDPTPEPDPDPYTEFTWAIVTTESQIEVTIVGHYVYVSGNGPIIGGSMYAYIYRDGDYMDVIDLITSHNFNSSTFTFDYSPVYFGNFSFDFYLNDPYLATPQLICNATFKHEEPPPDPDPYTEFTWVIVTTESRIEVTIAGHYVYVSGNGPIIGGSMYAYIYRDGDYMDIIDLVTSHNFNSSTFIFDYSPVYFGNYSFDFYLNDPYLAIPQLICNATFEHEEPPPDPDPYTEFTWIISPAESWIEFNITGSYVFHSWHEPIFGGSMYVYIYLDGNYVEEFDLITTHNLQDTSFIFGYGPKYFGNYSFDFYLNDPYLSNPQLIFNATFEHRNLNQDPDPDPDPDPIPDPNDDPNELYRGDALFTQPLAFGIMGIASVSLLGSSKTIRAKLFKKKRSFKN